LLYSPFLLHALPLSSWLRPLEAQIYRVHCRGMTMNKTTLNLMC
jgi:hypothetical protein